MTEYGSGMLSTGDEQEDIARLAEAFAHACLRYKFPKTAHPTFGWVRIPESGLSLAYWHYKKPNG